MAELTDWLRFKAEQDDPAEPECLFCGVHHTVVRTHPFCTMATQFKFWQSAKGGKS